jgi:hypothetical protein
VDFSGSTRRDFRSPEVISTHAQLEHNSVVAFLGFQYLASIKKAKGCRRFQFAGLVQIKVQIKVRLRANRRRLMVSCATEVKSNH